MQNSYTNDLVESPIGISLKGSKFAAALVEVEDKERRRLARELHDSLGQQLTAISLNFASLRQEFRNMSNEGKDKFSLGMNLLRDAMKESRAIAHNLMPQSICDYGFVGAIENLLTNLQSAIDIEFQFYHNLKNSRFNEQVELSLFRITQEAVNNALKHANADTISIQLIKFHDLLILTVEDDGQGFKAGIESDQFGLNGMELRAFSMSGTMSIDTKPGEGTIITIQIPQ